MKVAIDASGRLVLPKAARTALRIEGQAVLELRVLDDHIEISPVPVGVTLTRRDGFVVAMPKDRSLLPLSNETVEDVRRQIREERGKL